MFSPFRILGMAPMQFHTQKHTTHTHTHTHTHHTHTHTLENYETRTEQQYTHTHMRAQGVDIANRHTEGDDCKDSRHADQTVKKQA